MNEGGDLELLCTKPGEGSLALGGAALALKEAKAIQIGFAVVAIAVFHAIRSY